MQKMVNYFVAVAILTYPLAVSAETKGGVVMKIRVESSVFTEGGLIPRKYACDGADISPPLSWSGIPEGSKSLAIIADDPDAPAGTWVHWVVYNLPTDLIGLPENIPKQKTLTSGGAQGTTDFRKVGYGGPCPPSGTHRYFFKVYALDALLDLDAGATKKELLKAMEGHIIAQGEVVGKYKR